MLGLGCLWNRLKLERYADRALSRSAMRSVGSHLDRCSDCRDRIQRLTRIDALVRSTVADPAEPDWADFWPSIRVRISNEEPRPLRDPWWLPFWKPFWGHPRLAMGGVMVVILAAVLSIWPLPGRDGQVPMAYAGPVTVQDVGTPDPERAVMVYATPDHALTVIWLFSPEAPSEES